ncbi:hypothetical protein [Lentzea aerocolonigenes]|nr:hypothetical protein [Lentzea aerocolonigenes]
MRTGAGAGFAAWWDRKYEVSDLDPARRGGADQPGRELEGEGGRH